ncbi:MBL fold metallo-hydrolase [candidate division GN15 bacterium]|uniref:MBL fold metallo-hydrolase n=1 Tax=candidate division GN15 bacterium TaxID=2072418 RepID=A0A855X412_9BACT|nr:MAG: MBL fold metallo-hydrolase [candidate division GN15 bacterium]
MHRKIETLIVSPYAVNCYLYWDRSTGDGIIVDPGGNESEIVESVKQYNFTPRGVLLTHGHADHIGAVEEIRAAFSIPLYAGKAELELLQNPERNLSAVLGQSISIKTPEHLVSDEDVLLIGSLRLLVLATPGHTPGGVCYLDESGGNLFCGDVLFQGSIGRTDLPGGDYQVLQKSIQSKIMALPDAVVCYPGHGPRTMVGAERRSNPFLTGAYFA